MGAIIACAASCNDLAVSSAIRKRAYGKRARSVPTSRLGGSDLRLWQRIRAGPIFNAALYLRSVCALSTAFRGRRCHPPTCIVLKLRLSIDSTRTLCPTAALQSTRLAFQRFRKLFVAVQELGSRLCLLSFRPFAENRIEPTCARPECWRQSRARACDLRPQISM